jgi:uncharacterized membrane protein
MRARRYRVIFGVLCVLVLAAAGPMVHGHAQTHDDGVHDHDDDHEGRGIISLLGRLHSPAVHFPIALVITAALAEVLSALKGGDRYAFAARFMLYVAALGGVAAAAVGFAAAAGESFSDQQAVNFTFHRILGVATPVLIFLTLGLSESARRTGTSWQHTAYQVILFVTVISIVMGAYLGGTL